MSLRKRVRVGSNFRCQQFFVTAHASEAEQLQSLIIVLAYFTRYSRQYSTIDYCYRCTVVYCTRTAFVQKRYLWSDLIAYSPTTLRNENVVEFVIKLVEPIHKLTLGSTKRSIAALVA